MFNALASAPGQAQHIQMATGRAISGIMALGLRQFPRADEKVSSRHAFPNNRIGRKGAGI